MKILCLGCGRAFSWFGCISHLAQTRNPPCHKLAAQERTLQTQATSSPELSKTMFGGTPTPDGDYFGTYDVDDMPWPSPPSPRCRATDLDVDSEEDVLMDGPGGSCTSVSDSQDNGSEDDSNDDEKLEVADGERGADSDVTTDVNDSHVIIETFPPQYGDPGIAMERGSGSLYEKYSNCQEDSEDNVYAPFKSKLDWDFARWAKLRGPGSMALDEFLRIDGVSMILFQSVCVVY